MERIFNLKTKDDKKIYCLHNTGIKKNKSVVIFVHGLTGNPNEHLFYNAAHSFPKKGVDVFRFALYWWSDEKHRKLDECSLTTHVEDLNTTLRYLRPKYKNIIVVGHSLGSPVILKADITLFDNVILWEPSYLEKGIRHELTEVKVNKQTMWLSRDAFSYILKGKLISEWEEFNGKNELHLIAELGKPLKIIAGKKGILLKGSRAYFKVAKEPKELIIIDNATHCFDEAGTEAELLKETLSWVKLNSN